MSTPCVRRFTTPFVEIRRVGRLRRVAAGDPALTMTTLCRPCLLGFIVVEEIADSVFRMSAINCNAEPARVKTVRPISGLLSIALFLAPLYKRKFKKNYAGVYFDARAFRTL